ncbi:50S ribosomal protein L25/general stress protein Ctc [Vagococcus vulneris]|uniref:Large ribosomal subunit protein bL25 n=1 Tax=Vagococcus vulneris TaxID=1977869 RepID=A0A429ZXT9_9ENTE|nr:50S ribosomal protein L25/general stress protein Ctc [Vagococcus vulneris]RST98715.1 50S ribosomal protein L25/general stress protein Ctc [Vagococcus vulneris]
MSVVLKVEERTTRPRSLRKQLRKEGRVPAAVNGNGIQNLSISCNAKELDKAIRENGLNAVYTLDLNGKKISTLLHTYELDTFTKAWIHAEFLAVDMNEKQEVEADVTLLGTPHGVKKGGILEQTLYSVVVSATPDKLPERVEIDVTHLEIGESLSIKDIPEHPEFEIVTDEIEQICTVAEPNRPEEDIEGTGTVTEPEVINSKQEEE